MLGQSRGHVRSEKGQVWRLSWYAHCEISRPCLPHRLRGTQDRPTGRRGPQDGVREGRLRQRASTHPRVRYARRGSTLGLQRVPPQPAAGRQYPIPPQPAGARRRPGPHLCRAFLRRAGRHSLWSKGRGAAIPAVPFAGRMAAAGGRQGRRPCPCRPPRAPGWRQDPRSRQWPRVMLLYSGQSRPMTET